VNKLNCFAWSLDRLREELPEYPVITKVADVSPNMQIEQELLTRIEQDVFVLQQYSTRGFSLCRAVPEGTSEEDGIYVYDEISKQAAPDLYRYVEQLFETSIMEILL